MESLSLYIEVENRAFFLYSLAFLHTQTAIHAIFYKLQKVQILQTCNKILKQMASHVHTLNDSPSHQKYSFSKDQRFVYDKPKTDVYYLPKIDRDRKSALIGYGQRSLANINQKSYKDTPHAYSIPSSINIKKGNSFSSGRQEIGGPLQLLKYNKQYPSPLNYQLSSSLQKNGGKFGVKLKDFSLKYLESLPGPGSYSLPSTVDGSDGKDRKIYESRFSSGGSYKIGNLHQSMILNQNKPAKFQVPGPGQYNVQKYGLSNPQNILQKHSSVKFPKQRRSQVAKRGAQKEPGPGQYKIYSQFD